MHTNLKKPICDLGTSVSACRSHSGSHAQPSRGRRGPELLCHALAPLLVQLPRLEAVAEVGKLDGDAEEERDTHKRLGQKGRLPVGGGGPSREAVAAMAAAAAAAACAAGKACASTAGRRCPGSYAVVGKEMEVVAVQRVPRCERRRTRLPPAPCSAASARRLETNSKCWPGRWRGRSQRGACSTRRARQAAWRRRGQTPAWRGA